MVIAPLLYCFYFLELSIVSYYDIRTKKIKNYWSVFNITLALLSYIFYSDIFLLSLGSLKYPLVFFIIGFALYWVKVMGAGDVKFIATFFLVIPPPQHHCFLDGLMYSTIFVGAALLLINTVKHFKFVISCILIKNFRGLKILMGKKFSYAPVVLLAWMYIGYLQFLQ